MKYAAKKTAMMLLTMVIVSFLAFLAFQIIPGDAAVNKLGSDATVEAVEALRHEMGLDRPFFVRYGEWVLGAATSARPTAIPCPFPRCSRGSSRSRRF